MIGINSNIEATLSAELINGYIQTLTNRFYKILPIFEKEPVTLGTYLKNLQSELLGFQELAGMINNDSYYVSLMSILQYLISYPEFSYPELRRQVFKAIDLCEKIKQRYLECGV